MMLPMGNKNRICSAKIGICSAKAAVVWNNFRIVDNTAQCKLLPSEL